MRFEVREEKGRERERKGEKGEERKERKEKGTWRSSSVLSSNDLKASESYVVSV